MTSNSPTPAAMKVMAVLVALLSGTVAALVAYILARHTSPDLGQALTWSSGSFLAITYLVFKIEDKIGL
ncbi:hypothetical protein FNV65_06760 [Streptomyces sp. S1A1-8]|uniref:hypothetical protein n=1 Tax=unclassified Streptomyces TaxID=2593676 RepID=UPI001163FA45|nr:MULTISPECIES: hypothetical protein [unclassified Streptomyces]QDN96032.1 hypothetical protein FNV58_08185 [Streptomyces sp. RLB1-9]QDO17753.1 hypothetical protein FNV65_06760 [Streptomyces sp. S1A1-8]QDO27881.1 hypothetical protein FNV63_06770 [Streptomyces sp. S1A1-3]